VELPPVAYKDDERDLGEKYKNFAGASWDTKDVNALIAFARSPDRPTKEGLLDYDALAELYRDYVLSQDVDLTKRKEDVARALAAAGAGLPRKDTKTHMGSEDRHKQNTLEREIKDLTTLQQILDRLPG
jgi:hypothetical protein